MRLPACGCGGCTTTAGSWGSFDCANAVVARGGSSDAVAIRAGDKRTVEARRIWRRKPFERWDIGIVFEPLRTCECARLRDRAREMLAARKMMLQDGPCTAGGGKRATADRSLAFEAVFGYSRLCAAGWRAGAMRRRDFGDANLLAFGNLEGNVESPANHHGRRVRRRKQRKGGRDA